MSHPSLTDQQLLDELQVFCPAARVKASAAIHSSTEDYAVVCLREALEVLLDHTKKHDMALQSLTPGGSEYVNDRDRCVQYIRQIVLNTQERADEAVRKLRSFTWLAITDVSFHDPVGTIWRQRDGVLYAILNNARDRLFKLPEPSK